MYGRSGYSGQVVTGQIEDDHGWRGSRQAIKRARWLAGWRCWPHRLRNTAATRIRQRSGIEIARVILGYSTVFTIENAAEVIWAIG